MSEAGQEDRDESAGLYVGWDELRRRISPALGRDRFRALVKGKVDRAGFPPFSEEWGGFYWPNVRRWLDSQNEVGANAAVRTIEDGPETFDAPARTRARPQARPPQPAVLDGQPGHAGSARVSRHLHSVASGGDR